MNPIIPDRSTLSEFWEWFASLIIETRNVFQDKEFVDALDTRVHELGISSWEMGVGLKAAGNKSFVLSPGGRREMLELTTAVIDMAPEIEGWEFYSAKPPKAWDRRFSVRDRGGKKFEIDARNWSYCLLKGDSEIEIIIKAPEILELPDIIWQTAAELLVEGEIGEAARMRDIASIVVLEDFEKELVGKSSPIGSLREHFAQLSLNVE